MTRTELLKISKPILFNTEMVRAILDGRKTVTRGNPFHFEFKDGYNPCFSGYSLGEYYTGHINLGVCLYSRGSHDVWGVRTNVVNPKYKKGDILYVRETFCKFGRRMFHGYRCYQSGHTWTAYKSDKAMYLEDDHVGHLKNTEKFDIGVPIKWRPSIHMPKSAARIFLKVTDVRVERLQDITVEQAIKEGFEGIPCGCSMTGCTDCYDSGWSEPPQVGFMYTWDSTIKKQDLDKYSWEANPWVWVYEFERVGNNARIEEIQADINIDRLAEICEAEREGRCVVLPCKVGDTVYFLTKQLDIINELSNIVIDEYIVTEIRGNKYNPLWYMASSERCIHRDFHPTELGKTVFLTREEAEKALAEMEENNENNND